MAPSVILGNKINLFLNGLIAMAFSVSYAASQPAVNFQTKLYS